MKPCRNTTVLDVGGQISLNSKDNLQFIDDYPWKKNLTTINVSSQHINSISKKYSEIDAKVCDACDLPWADKHFDIIYSNAVIEHVGNYKKQSKMASEIMRVGKKWFVTTPNKLFPFEFHMRLPLITWFPGQTYLLFGRFAVYPDFRTTP